MHNYWTLMKKLIWLRILQGASFVVNKITGTSPITLTNAINSAIISLKQYGKCVQDGTPTPSSPVDIKCNNGVLTMMDDELPSGYKRITSIKFDGDFWYELEEALTGEDDVTMTLDDTVSSGQNVFGSYNGTAGGKKNFSLYIYGGSSTSSSYLRYGEQLVRPKLGSGERTITFGKSGTSGFQTDVTVTPEEFTTPANAYIGMLPNSSSPAYTGSIIGNVLVSTRLKYIPCERENDGVIGYYETVNGVFFEPIGTGTPVAGSYDTSHLNKLVVVGTPEVLTVSASGAETQTVTDIPMLLSVGDYADETEIISGLVTRKCRAKVLDGTESYTKANSGNTVRFRLNNVSDLITGSGLGRIPAIYSHFQDLSSTSSQSLGGAFAFPGRVIYFIPTDQTLDLNGWKSWVAQQYAAGTPVIVIYPLVQETTEQTTPHELHSYEGDTTVSWTAEVDGTVKTVEYVQGKQASNKVGTAKVGIAKAG